MEAARRFVGRVVLGLTALVCWEGDAAWAQDAAVPVPDPVAIVSPQEAVAPADASAAPSVTSRSDGFRSEVERAWLTGGTDLVGRVQQTRTRALQLGATSYEAASRAVLTSRSGGTALERARLAARLAPDLPFARIELARAYFDEAEYLSAGSEAVAAVRAIPRNLEATLWVAASLLTMFAAVLTLNSVAFMVWVGARAFRHAAHDLADLVSRSMPNFARTALLSSVLLLPLLLGESLMGVVLLLFLLGRLYGTPAERRALGLSAVLVVVGLYPMARLAGTALTALESDPVAVAAHAVVRSMASSSDLEVLDRVDEHDWLAAAALALHERRAGDPAVAEARYARLLEETPDDPVVLAVLSNMHFERGENEAAIELGERAAERVRSATLLFNLSQVYARTFRMEEFEGALAQAQVVDAAVVADLSQTADPQFVADLAFPLAPIRDRMLAGARGEPLAVQASRTVFPGRLGESWKHTAGAFLVLAVLAAVLRGRWEHSGNCARCGRRVCNRCDGTRGSGSICDGCHHLFHRPETTDGARRMARLGQLRAREARLGKLAFAASVLLPGVGGLLARRADLSFLALFFFAWACVLFHWREGVVVDPLAVGAAAPLLFGAAGLLAALAYAAVLGMSLAARRSL